MVPVRFSLQVRDRRESPTHTAHLLATRNATTELSLACFSEQRRFCNAKLLSRNVPQKSGDDSQFLSAPRLATRRDVLPRKHTTCASARRESSSVRYTRWRGLVVSWIKTNVAHLRWLWTGYMNVISCVIRRFKRYPGEWVCRLVELKPT